MTLPERLGDAFEVATATENVAIHSKPSLRKRYQTLIQKINFRKT